MRWVLACAALAGVLAVVVAPSGKRAAAADAPAATAAVERGRLSDVVSAYGTLAYRGSFVAIDRATGTYTRLPAEGDEVGCGEVLYRVDDRPVLLLCGSTPAYRTLSAGARGRDVAELNANLRLRSDAFGAATESALRRLQARLGEELTGSLELGRAVFLPGPVRVARVAAELGGTARPGTRVLSATSDTLEVQLALDPAQVRRGDRARITLPDSRSVPGSVATLGTVAAADGTISASIRLDRAVRGLDRAPVRVSITTGGVESALNVPVTAIVGRSGGGFAVEVVRAGGQRELVAVKLGLVDASAGRVQVDGALRVGDRVVVP